METIQPEDFFKAKLQVGEIIEVLPFDRARNPTYKLKISFGDNIKQSSAQVTNYSMEELTGKQVICVTNFPPRNVAGYESEVLVLGVSNTEGGITLLTTDKPSPLGTIVS